MSCSKIINILLYFSQTKPGQRNVGNQIFVSFTSDENIYSQHVRNRNNIHSERISNRFDFENLGFWV